MGQVIVITLTNKPDLVQEAIASVKAQTRECVHLVEVDSGQYKGRYPPAVHYNVISKQCSADDYISWLSDDDLMLPNFVADLAGMLDIHPEYGCVWGWSMHVVLNKNGTTTNIRPLPQDGNFMQVFNAANEAIFKLDGGQIMVRRSVLDKISYPYQSEDTGEPSRRCDGFLMNKIAAAVGIYPLGKQVKINRTTDKSGHLRIEIGRAHV